MTKILLTVVKIQIIWIFFLIVIVVNGKKVSVCQLQNNIGNRVPSYLKDLLGWLLTLSDDPYLSGLAKRCWPLFQM